MLRFRETVRRRRLLHRLPEILHVLTVLLVRERDRGTRPRRAGVVAREPAPRRATIDARGPELDPRRGTGIEDGRDAIEVALPAVTQTLVRTHLGTLAEDDLARVLLARRRLVGRHIVIIPC